MYTKLTKIINELNEIAEELREKCRNCTGTTENTKQLSTYNPGEKVRIGTDEYVVLKQDSQNNQTHILSMKMIESIRFGESKDFKKSNVLDAINNDILPRLVAAVGEENIIESTILLETVDKQNEIGLFTGKMRILSFDEAREYSNIIAAQKYPDYMWLLTPWSTDERGWKYEMAVVSPSGSSIGSNGCNSINGACPFCILKSNILISQEDK